MVELKFERLFEKDTPKLLMGGIRPEFRHIVDRFNVNISRVDTLRILLPTVAVMGMAWMEAVNEAEKAKVRGDTSRQEKVEKVRLKVLRKSYARHLTNMASNSADPANSFKHASPVFRGLTDDDNPQNEPYIPSWLQSLFVSTWTAFESLSGDLWESALNLHPDGLAQLRGKWPDNASLKAKEEKKRKVKSPLVGEEGQASEDTPSRLIKLSYLNQHNYDVSKSMGTIYRKYDTRFTFQSIWGIRDAYVFAFFEDCDEILTAINDPSLTALSKVRNVLVHKAGLVDKEFMEGSGKLPALSGAVIDKPLIVTGDMYRNIFDPVYDSCVRLFRGVSNWIDRHPVAKKDSEI